jgi:23S rRNA pseudouridine1911/1915/1917 synthase
MHYFKAIVGPGDSHQLGHFLAKKGISHRTLKNVRYNGGLLLVNHKRRLASYRLHTGDEVIVIMGREKENKWLKPVKGPLAIELETPDYLILNKPAGVLTTPTRYEDHDSLVNFLLDYLQKKGSDRPHVVTRLDRDTSGLVLVAKYGSAHDRFAQLGHRVLQKKYHAIVHGNFDHDEGRFDQPIGKVDDSVKRGVTANGRSAHTLYRVLAQKPGASLVEVKLLTGRTHQIRVHFAASGHPLFGDQLYGEADGFDRQALNAFSLAFPDPFNGQRRLVEIPDPLDMQDLWQQL